MTEQVELGLERDRIDYPRYEGLSVEKCPVCGGSGEHWQFADRPDRCRACGGAGKTAFHIVALTSYETEYIPTEVPDGG